MFVITGLATWSLAPDARACSCAPWVDVLWPREGSMVPADHLVVLDVGCGGAADQLHVEVDGQAAMLVADEERLAGLGHAIVPRPPVGTLVEITGCPGWASCDEAPAPGEAEPAGRIVLAFHVAPPDETLPAAPQLGDLDYVEVEAPLPGGCDQTRPARDWSFHIDGQAPGRARLYLVELGPAGAETTRAVRVAIDGGTRLPVVVRRFEDDASSEICATVRTFDLAGHEAPTVETCRRLAADETLAPVDRGCSVGAAPRTMAGAALLLLGIVIVRRRRSIRRPPPAPRCEKR